MTPKRSKLSNEKGMVLVYMAGAITVLLLFSGLAVDTGRIYIVKAQLTKALDGAALGAARNMNSGNPTAEAQRIFNANFPANFFGATLTSGPTVSVTTDAGSGRNIVDVSASASLPTTFMRLGNFTTMNVNATAEATRRMVDLSLVLDVSGSIGAKWPTVRDSARAFIDSFDAAHDRVSLATFSNGATVIDQMPSSRGFNKTQVEADVPGALPGGSTNMAEGLYRGWDELRSVPSGTQSGLRVIVLFTDGASNGLPGSYDVQPGVGRSLRTADFPKSPADTTGQTSNNPAISGLYNTQGGAQTGSWSYTPARWDSTVTIGAGMTPPVAGLTLLPLNTFHPYHRSSGVPTAFPLQSSMLTINGVPQNVRRGLRNQDAASGRYPADVWNTNNAARNVLEEIANAARSDNGDYPIRIFTIGMGDLVRYLLGTMPEMPEDILKRLANDKTSPDYNSAQAEGKYYFALTETDVAPAFESIQNEIIRLSK
jgi:Flp pilus assembly protein TadG